MSTCKDCQFRKRPGNKVLCFLNPPEMRQREGFSLAVRPVIEDSDPACSHFKRGEGSPGCIMLSRYSTGEAAIDNCFDTNRALFEWMRTNIPKGISKMFRLEPVEE